MITLTYGYQKPQTNDRGPVVFPAMEANIQQLNDHTHNGVDSAQLSSKSIAKTTTAISSVGWVLVSGGHYIQTVTVPSGTTYDTLTIQFKLTTGEIVFPSVAKVSSTQYSVTFDDNTKSLVALIN